jgi:hypothetical protein
MKVGLKVEPTNKPEKNPPLPSYPVSLAPGTAEATIFILSSVEKEKDYICEAEIRHVHGYGSATHSLFKDTQIVIKASKNLMKRKGIDPADAVRVQAIKRWILRFQKKPAGQKTEEIWEVVDFLNQKT